MGTGFDVNFDGSTQRRLPVYLVLDTSGSMAGDGIEAVNQGLNVLVTELLSRPQAVETVWLSVITFDSSAKQVVPLTELIQFRPPYLSAGGATALGAALNLLKHAIEQEVIPNRPGDKGDYKPIVFLMLDGEPTDNWHNTLTELRNLNGPTPSIVALGAGSAISLHTLQQITDTALTMRDPRPHPVILQVG